MTDAWEMHQAETGLNPGPVWRDRGVIINTLTRDKQALEARVAELELAALKLRDNTQGAHEREAALRARIEALVDEWDSLELPSPGDHDYTRRTYRISGKRKCAAALRAALASPAEDTTPTEQQAQGGALGMVTSAAKGFAAKAAATAEQQRVAERVTSYAAARYRLGELVTPMGWRLGDVIARLVLDSGAVLPAPAADPSGVTP